MREFWYYTTLHLDIIAGILLLLFVFVAAAVGGLYLVLR